MASPCFLARRDPRLERLPRPLVIGTSPVVLVTHRDLARVPRVRATIDAITTYVRARGALLAGD